ncbi:hypothetical protein [Sphingobium sp. Ant17]|uniref:hypothetical protein n=1 Tax=Sphingobium sp. Ant17 TaxID=1461752 RepID=UPI001F187D4B|nr:hypothetical protein [Sphingobium sp. Ant17]
MAKRVVEEIGDKLLQQPSIAHRPYRGGYRCDEQMAACFHIGAVGVDQFLNQLIQRHVLKMGAR